MRLCIIKKTGLASVAVCAIAFLGATAAIAQQSDTDALQITFTTTTFSDADMTPRTIASGTYTVAPDGRRRIEKRDHRTGRQSVEIFDYPGQRRVTLDLANRTASVSSTTAVPSQTPEGARFDRQATAGLAIDTVTTPLGTKAFGDVILEGTRFTHTYSGGGRHVVHTSEVWIYRFPDPRIVPITMETRFEGDGEIVESRVQSVTSVKVPTSTFEIPHGFTATQRD